jgi:hypothetical protein
MPPPSPAPARGSDSAPDWSRLLRDLGAEVRRGPQASEARVDLATGLPAIDALLDGGLARGRLSELTGPLSSGRTSLAFALLARATARGEVVGMVDGADAFHPASARAAGVQLERVLWARPPGIAEAVRCCERLLRARGFAAVMLDTTAREREWQKLSAAVWQRLARAAAAGGSAFVVLSEHRVTGSFADLALELTPVAARFTGAPTLFEGLEIEAAIARQRRGRPRRPAAVRLKADAD